MENGTFITLPIECQIQSIEQYNDSTTGFAAHTKLPGKNPKLKDIPATGESKSYIDKNKTLKEYREYLAYLMHVSPKSSITRVTGNDFQKESTITKTYDLYEAFRSISRVPKNNTVASRTLLKYLDELYENRDKLIPTGEKALPKYIKFSDIPNPTANYTKYNQFFNELRSSLKKTIEETFELIDSSQKEPQNRLNPETHPDDYIM